MRLHSQSKNNLQAVNCLIDRKRTVRGSFRVAPFRIHCLMQNGSEKMFGKLHNTGLLHTQVHVAPLVKCAIAFLSLIRELKQLRSRQLQKTIGLMIKTTDCTCIINASCFLIHFFDVHYTTTAWNLLIWRFMEDVDIRRRIFLALFELEVLTNSTPRKVACRIWHIERIQIDAIKFERTQIHFFSDVFTAVVVVIA